jgi:hypothetical protein
MLWDYLWLDYKLGTLTTRDFFAFTRKRRSIITHRFGEIRSGEDCNRHEHERDQ